MGDNIEGSGWGGDLIATYEVQVAWFVEIAASW